MLIMAQKKWVLILLILVLLTMGCSSNSNQEPTQDINALYTAAAETMNATIGIDGPGKSTPTSTPLPSPTPILPTNTPGTPTAAIFATPTPGSSGNTNTCDVAGFVADITIPDGTEIAAGTKFTKTWEIKNDGTCTWDSKYELVYSSGEKMGGPETMSLITNTVAPGETLEISIELFAPDDTGKKVGYWILRNGQGQYFGIGTNVGALYVDITVISSSSTDTPTNTTAPSSDTETPTSTPTETSTPAATPTETPTPLPTS